MQHRSLGLCCVRVLTGRCYHVRGSTKKIDREQCYGRCDWLTDPCALIGRKSRDFTCCLTVECVRHTFRIIIVYLVMLCMYEFMLYLYLVLVQRVTIFYSDLFSSVISYIDLALFNRRFQNLNVSSGNTLHTKGNIILLNHISNTPICILK